LDDLAARGQTIVIVTHDMHIAQRARRLVRMDDGEVVQDEMTNDQTSMTTQRQWPSATDQSMISHE